MKIYNPFKKIRELERELEDSLNNFDSLKKEKERLKKELNYLRKKEEEHETGMWCIGCKNLIAIMEDTPYRKSELRFCMLDNPCKDRETENE